MSICTQVKGFARRHEFFADLLSLLAVVLLFSSIWIIIDYQSQITQWMLDNIIINGSAVLASIALDVALIMILLNIGSSRFQEVSDDGCFHTFRGRMHGGFSLGTAVKNWVKHIEQVNKKHR